MSSLEEEAFSDVTTCTGCNKCVEPPFDRCPCDLIYCKECCELYMGCRICKGMITANNFSRFEDKSPSNKNHFCKNEKYGCFFYGTAEEFEDHDIVCKWKPMKCPISTVKNPCEWIEKFSVLIKHVGDAHDFNWFWKDSEESFGPKTGLLEGILQPGNIVDKNWGPMVIFFMVTKDIFILTFSISTTNKLKCRVDHLTTREQREEKKYKYQMIFGRVGGVIRRKCVGNNCGLSSEIKEELLFDLCHANGSLSYQLEIFDKETHMEGDCVFDIEEL